MPKPVNRTKFKKAPGAPRRFKSSYMFYSSAMHKEIRQRLEKEGRKEKTTTIAKMVSKAWKELTPEERKPWDDKAAEDKARYEMEKSTYTGPWKVPARKRQPKDKSAPKRPMSAFLAYSNAKRSQVRKENPTLDNIDVSRVLAKMWKEAPEEEKKVFIDNEAEQRAEYKIAIREWRRQFNEKEAALQAEREAAAIEKLKSMPSPYDAMSASEESPRHSLVAAAASSLAATSTAAQLHAGSAAAAYPNASDYYGLPTSTAAPSSSFPPYGQNLANNSWLSRAAAQQYTPEEGQAFAAAYANANTAFGGNPYNTSNILQNNAYSTGMAAAPTSLARSLLGTSYDAAASANRAVYGSSTPFISGLSNTSFSPNNFARSLYDNAAEQQQRQQQQQSGGWASYLNPQQPPGGDPFL